MFVCLCGDFLVGVGFGGDEVFECGLGEDDVVGDEYVVCVELVE